MKSNARTIKVQERTSCPYAGYTLSRLPKKSGNFGRHMLIAIDEIKLCEAIWWFSGENAVRNGTRYIDPAGWDYLTSPPPPESDKYTCHCLLVVGERVIVTEESFSVVEQLIEQAKK